MYYRSFHFLARLPMATPPLRPSSLSMMWGFFAVQLSAPNSLFFTVLGHSGDTPV